MPPATSSLVTTIFTTSPTPSAPSTELLETVLESFRAYCADLITCRVVVVFDTYDRIEPKARLKKGTVTTELARDYILYKEKTKRLFLKTYRSLLDIGEGVSSEITSEMNLICSSSTSEYGWEGNTANSIGLAISQTVDKAITFVEPEARLGFGLAVRSGLRLTETPYVWVQQHDWELSSPIPLALLVDVMNSPQSVGKDAQAPIKYICLPNSRMLPYSTSAHVTEHAELRSKMASLERNFVPPNDLDSSSIPLTPFFFWHDKPHIASTAHYLQRIFPSRTSIGRGEFIEDTVGHRARTQMKDGSWTKWGTWLYSPDDEKTECVRHLKGRTYRGIEGESVKIEQWRVKNRSRRKEARAKAIAKRTEADTGNE